MRFIFSVQYCLTAQLVLGVVRLDAFRPETLNRDDIRSLMPLITVAEDMELSSAYPKKRMARVCLRLNDGREFEHFQRTRKGDPEDPLSDAELVAKFEELATTVVTKADADALRQCILHEDVLPGTVRIIPHRHAAVSS